MRQVALVRQVDAFARGELGALMFLRAPLRRGLGEAYEARRDLHALAVERAVQIPEFFSELAEGLAGVNLFASDPVAPKKLVAAAGRLDALSAEAAQEGEAEVGELREENGTLRERNETLTEDNKTLRERIGTLTERNETLTEENRALVAELRELRGRAGNLGGR